MHKYAQACPQYMILQKTRRMEPSERNVNSGLRYGGRKLEAAAAEVTGLWPVICWK